MSGVPMKKVKDLTQEDLDLLYSVPKNPCYICKSVKCYKPECIKLYTYQCAMKKYENTGLEEIAKNLVHLNSIRGKIKELENELNKLKETEATDIKNLQETGILDTSGYLIRTLDDLNKN